MRVCLCVVQGVWVCDVGGGACVVRGLCVSVCGRRGYERCVYSTVQPKDGYKPCVSM